MPSTWMIRMMVVVAGMTTMATEMAASRLLAPYFGASVMVWANIIGLFLIYLSVGYWYGGRLADRNPTVQGLCKVTALAAASIAVVPFMARPILSIASGSIESVAVSSVLGSFLGCLVLMSVPITLLGIVPPYAIRLAIVSVDSSGQVAGSLYALSTIGSIAGTFGSVLVTIPWIGTRNTMLLFALVLASLSAVGLRGRMQATTGVAALLMVGAMLVPVGIVKEASAGTVLFEDDSRYQFVQVVAEEGSQRRLLQLNEGWAVHSIFDPDSVLSGGIWDAFLTIPALSTAPGTRDSERTMTMLLIGNAAGSAARSYAKYRPNVAIDGVELDPLVSKVGRRYFDMGALEQERLTIHHADGRPFLAHAGEQRWDVIHIDAYRQPYIPFYLTTREFFTLVREHLAPGGVVSINVGSAPDDPRINEAVAATMREVFPTVVRWRAEHYNEVIAGVPTRASVAQLAARLRASDLATDPALRDQFTDFAAQMQPVARGSAKVLTDDHAPVEWMTDRMILGEAS